MQKTSIELNMSEVAVLIAVLTYVIKQGELTGKDMSKEVRLRNKIFKKQVSNIFLHDEDESDDQVDAKTDKESTPDAVTELLKMFLHNG